MVKRAGNTGPINPISINTPKVDTPKQSNIDATKDIKFRPQSINKGNHRDKTALQNTSKIETKFYGSHSQQATQSQLTMKIPEKVNAMNDAITKLPENPDDLPPQIIQITEDEVDGIAKAFTTESPTLQGVKDGSHHYSDVLSNLNRLEQRLGGSPIYNDVEPHLNDPDAHKLFFGIPLPMVKDWFEMTLQDQWKPEFFWTFLAERFGVTAHIRESQYEYAHLTIQRIGIIMANKERVFEILDSQDDDLHSELFKMSGLMFHLDQNTPSIEKDFIDITDQFLTVYYENAKAKGDDALVTFFKALDGVCFEARARSMADYIMQNPLREAAEETQALTEVSDWDSTNSFKQVFDIEYSNLGQKIGTFRPRQLFDVLKTKDVFKLEFTEDGEKKRPSLEKFQEYTLNYVNEFLMNNDLYSDFLNTELEIFKDSGKEQTKDSFIAHLNERLSKFDNPIELYAEDTSGDIVPFSVESDKTKAFISDAVTKGLLA